MFYGVDLSSRLLLGTARYPSPATAPDQWHCDQTGTAAATVAAGTTTHRAADGGPDAAASCATTRSSGKQLTR